MDHEKSSNVVKAEECNYSFGDAIESNRVASDFDPEARGFENLEKPGTYIFKIETFTIAFDNDFKHKDMLWRGNQLRPRLVVAGGDQTGKSIIDFLPLPTPSAEVMPGPIANRWGQFIRCCGFPISQASLVPSPSFKIHHIIGRLIGARIIEDEYEGKKKIKVAFMGYLKPEEVSVSNGSPPDKDKAADSKQKAPAPTRETKAASLADDL